MNISFSTLPEDRYRINIPKQQCTVQGSTGRSEVICLVHGNGLCPGLCQQMHGLVRIPAYREHARPWQLLDQLILRREYKLLILCRPNKSWRTPHIVNGEEISTGIAESLVPTGGVLYQDIFSNPRHPRFEAFLAWEGSGRSLYGVGWGAQREGGIHRCVGMAAPNFAEPYSSGEFPLSDNLPYTVKKRRQTVRML